MTIVPKYENLKAEDSRTLPAKQTAVESTLKADENSGIKNVLTITCDASLISIEGVSGEARYSGKIDYKVLYEDVSGNINTLTYYADFNDKAEDPSITPVSQLSCNLNVVETEITGQSKDELKLTCVIEALIRVDNISQVSILAGGDGFFYNTASANTSNYSGGGKGVCEVSDEFEVKGAVKKILLSEASVIAGGVIPGIDSVSAEGEAIVKITYLTENGGENNISGITRIMPFRHEIEAKDAAPQDKAFAECNVKALKVNALVDEEKGMTAINIICEVELTAKSYKSNCINYVDDAFSPECQTNLTYTNINSKTFIGSYNYKQAIEGVANLDDDMIPAEKVLASSNSRIHIAKVAAEAGWVTVEGIAVTTVIYSGTKEGVLKTASVNVEIPFSKKFETEGARVGDNVKVNAAVTDVDAKCRKGKEIEVSMQIKIRADLFSDEVITALSDVEASDAEIPKQSSISIYFPSVNERLWDIAKQLSVSPDTVMAFNPDLKFPVNPETKVFVYRQKF